MRKRILPLIALCLMTTPVYAAGTIDAVIPVSCTAKNSNEEFKVSIKGDNGNQASPETVYIKDGETENVSVSFSTPGAYKYIVRRRLEVIVIQHTIKPYITLMCMLLKMTAG